MRRGGGPIDRAVGWWVTRVASKPRLTLSILIALVIGSVIAAIQGLSVNTDTRHMLSSELTFQQWTRAVDNAFPMLEGGIVVVARGKVEEAVDQVLGELADRLANRSDVLTDVYSPKQTTSLSAMVACFSALTT